MTLLDGIETTRFSDDAADLFTVLARGSLADESGRVVLCAAAHLLASEASCEDDLFGLMDEFAEVAEAMLAHMGRPARHLLVVGGRDA